MAIRPFFNPIEGDIDFTFIQDSAPKVQETFNLDGIAAIGDLIVPSDVVAESVKAIADNTYDNVVFGVIVGFETPTRVQVLVSGKLKGITYQLGGLTFGKALYVGTNGKFTTTPPLTGNLQAMGIALKSDSIFLLPSITKVQRA